MTDIKEQVRAKSVSQIINESALGRALEAYNKYGYDLSSLSKLKLITSSNARSVKLSTKQDVLETA